MKKGSSVFPFLLGMVLVYDVITMEKPYFNRAEKPGDRPAHNYYFSVMYYYVYLLQSKKTKKFYVGFTSNLKRRLAQHNNGENKSTKSDAPYELIYFEGFKSKSDALIREKKLKHHGQGIRRLKERLDNSIEK